MIGLSGFGALAGLSGFSGIISGLIASIISLIPVISLVLIQFNNVLIRRGSRSHAFLAQFLDIYVSNDLSASVEIAAKSIPAS